MKILTNFFRPNQPKIPSVLINKVSYIEIKPSKEYSNYIFCFWQLRSNQTLSESFKYRVVSDGCIDILLEAYSSELYITGFSKKYLEYDLGTSFNYFGVRFYPFMFPFLFNVSADLLTNQFLNLNEVALKLHSSIKSNLKSSEIDLLDFKQLLQKSIDGLIKFDNQSLDSRLVNAVEEIIKSKGTIDLNTIDVGISQRQLRRKFQYFFGDTPKVFAKIVRFQNILNSKPSNQSLKQNKIYFDLGYFDQSHFIKEFKEFYGVTPSIAFRNK